MIANTPMLITTPDAVTLEVRPSSGDEHEHLVLIVDHTGRHLVSFLGTREELHSVFLGLHTVLIDASVSPEGRAELIIPGRRPAAEPADGEGYTSGQA